MKEDGLLILCPACGGALPIATRNAQVQCGHCRAQYLVDERWLKSIGTYEVIGGAQLGQEALALRYATMHAAAARYNGRLIASVFLYAIALTWWAVAGASGVMGSMPLIILLASLGVSVVLTLGVALVWSNAITPPDDQQLLGTGLARCAGCSGFVCFERGEAIADSWR